MAEVGRARWSVGELESSSTICAGPTSSLVLLMGPPNAQGPLEVVFATGVALGGGERRAETEGEGLGA